MAGHSATPLIDMLRAADGRERQHMPGHKGRQPEGFPLAAAELFALDQTELPCTDDLFAPERGIAAAEALAAKSARAGATVLLTGGATSGLLAMVLASVPPGGTLIVPRDCHHSVLSACVWGDIQPVFVQPRAYGVLTCADAGDIEAALRAHPEASAVLITRPDYCGACVDLARVAEAARAAGVPLLVDEAHGAHWNWPVPGQPRSAGMLGADAWVQSAHKTLPALTGAAWLHLRREEDAPRARAMLRMLHSSSPSFAIMASLDAARAWMDAHGAGALRSLHARVQAFWHMLPPTLRDAQEVLRDAGVAFDPARIVLDPAAHGYTGLEVAARLAESGIDVEMADARRAVLIPTVCDAPDSLARVAAVLSGLPRREPLPCGVLPAFAPPEACMRVREAALSPAEWVPFSRAAGRVASRSAGRYPPGVPLIVPGERASAEIIGALVEAGDQAFGVARGALCCVMESRTKARGAGH